MTLSRILPDSTAITLAYRGARIHNALAMISVMGPHGRAVPVHHVNRVEVVSLNESIVDDDCAIAPAGIPTPAIPAAPTAAEKASDRNARAKENARAVCGVVPARIRIVHGGSPDPKRIINGYVNDIWIRGSDDNDWLAGILRSDHLLLWSGNQLTRLLRRYAHSLNGSHHVRLLRKERIAEISRPGDVLVQAFQHVRKHH